MGIKIHTEESLFKRGLRYTRQDIGWICLPETGRPSGGNWDTGYVRVEDKLIIFMNIGVPGRTNHDFDNRYDESNGTIVWYGKPRCNSQQPTFKKIINGEYTLHFFARWDNNDPEFTYLGIGKYVSHQDDVSILVEGVETYTIEIKLTCFDVGEIVASSYQRESGSTSTDGALPLRNSFALEQHLEHFIVSNWRNIPLFERYDIYEGDGSTGVQFATSIGRIDILAISRDRSEYLVIELKRGRASDVVAGQIARYMGWVQEELAVNGEHVSGCIIALEDDERLQSALRVIPNVEFMRYEISFALAHHSE